MVFNMIETMIEIDAQAISYIKKRSGVLTIGLKLEPAIGG